MITEVIGVAFLIFGLFFCIVGVVGVMRMPDIYTRLHASGKVATLGLFGLLVGSTILMPSIFFKALALGLFILFTSPVTTHAIAASDYRRREIIEELLEMESQPEEEKTDIGDVDATAIFSRSSLKDIMEAQVRSQQNQPDNTNE